MPPNYKETNSVLLGSTTSKKFQKHGREQVNRIMFHTENSERWTHLLYVKKSKGLMIHEGRKQPRESRHFTSTAIHRSFYRIQDFVTAVEAVTFNQLIDINKNNVDKQKRTAID